MASTSDRMKGGLSKAPHRSLLKADGLTDVEIARPLVAVVNSANEIIPGHLMLDKIGEAVKAGVYMAGGTPFEISTIGVCDGIAMNHAGMRYSLASREVIADSVEIAVRAHAFDAVVMIPNCDKVIPGMLMAAARLDLPTVVISGGPMLAGRGPKGEAVDLDTVFTAVGKVTAGTMSAEDLLVLEEHACPTCGSCAGLFTANSMNCLVEAIGIGLPGNGTIPAVYSERIRLAKKAGMRVMDLLAEGVTARQIMNAASIRNAMTLDMAFGGSSNTVLHLTAIAHEADADITLDDWAAVSARTPNLVRISPASELHMEDLYVVGGIPAIMGELDRAGLDRARRAHRRRPHDGRDRRGGACSRRPRHPHARATPTTPRAACACCAATSRPTAPWSSSRPCRPRCACSPGPRGSSMPRRTPSRRFSPAGSSPATSW